MIFSEQTPSVRRYAFRWLFGFYLISVLGLGSVLRVSIYRGLAGTGDQAQLFLAELDRTLIYSFWAFVVIGALFSFIFVKNFFGPLGILIKKAKRVSRGELKVDDQLIIRESRGEWYQLDLALGKIAKDLNRKKAEVKKERGELEAVISAANDAILAVDRDMNIRYYNAPMAVFFDQPEEEIWGRRLTEVIRNQNIIEAIEKSLKTRASERVQTSHELSIDSTTHYFQLSVSPFFDEQKNKTRGAVAIFHDITEHKKVDKVRMDFVANASHELKTPLTSIQGYLDVIRSSGTKDPQVNEAFKIVDNNLSRLNRLISDLLKLSKVEAAEAVAVESLQSHLVTEEVLIPLRELINQKKHNVSMPTQDIQVVANRELLDHVITNIVENAVKYCPPGSDIKISWGVRGSYTYMSVKDNGPGIESYHQGRLFERFYRVRDEKNQHAKGTGLGLSIVKNTMQAMEGTVDVKSAPGLGTEFICYFPNKLV